MYSIAQIKELMTVVDSNTSYNITGKVIKNSFNTPLIPFLSRACLLS